jgi:hypothetical protein
MTYCPALWISDYTYHLLMLYFQSSPVAVANMAQTVSTADRLVVVGALLTATQELTLQPLYVVPDALDVEPRVLGAYAIVLRGAAGEELARYPFTPDVSEGDVSYLAISELVPYVAGTLQVDIEGPAGLLVSRRAGGALPGVTLTSPNGGELLSSDPVTVTWTATDPDEDPLTFNVQYSPDNGASWTLVAQNLTGNSASIAGVNLPSGAQALFRVWASDGVHTSFDVSDASATVPNHIPDADISAPDAAVTIATSQTLALLGRANDIDTGSMDSGQLLWESSLDGPLGNGARLSVTGLSVGTHTISFRADDGAGGIVTDTVQVIVVGDLDQLPPVPDQLVAGPAWLSLDAAQGVSSARLSIGNANLENAIQWQAAASEPWLQLTQASGLTPSDDVIVTADTAGLPDGTHFATIAITSQALPAHQVVIQVELVVSRHRLFLPLVRR